MGILWSPRTSSAYTLESCPRNSTFILFYLVWVSWKSITKYLQEYFELIEGAGGRKGNGSGKLYNYIYIHIYCLFLCFERFHCIVLANLKLKFRDLPACFSVMGLKVCVAGWCTPLNLKKLLCLCMFCLHTTCMLGACWGQKRSDLRELQLWQLWLLFGRC